MDAQTAIAQPNGAPTLSFVGEWRGSGAFRGLPLRMICFALNGTATGPFIGLSRLVWAGVEGGGLRVGETYVKPDGTPTEAMLAKWQTWTS